MERVVRLLSAAGAAAVTVHGRTMEQRWVGGRLRREGVRTAAGLGQVHSATEVGWHARAAGRGWQLLGSGRAHHVY